ncbi:alpha/beta hydrolase fold domain-containing protein [Oricola sp.]|uniref:alpha/beta hydrolase fold domain-containing protein n=1 Tax=Oricola sp. TaxID=1979950 RepID=UPI0025EB92BB|nr:alpha/beta hydrolase fold domain-containing protein [Oricola sp.]MCI5073657.1 alpha/beta hydrolase [Oricola sp.]
MRALEAREIAFRVGRATGPALKAADTLMARGENLITKWWLARLIRRAVAIENDAAALAWLERLRTATADGAWSILPEGDGILYMASHMWPARLRPATSAAALVQGARDPAQPLFFYVAGGGFMLPPTPRQKAIADDIAAGFDAVAVMGEHRLAPENPFPLPVEDLCDHYLSLVGEGHAPSRIVVGGDSAGATLLLSMLVELRGRGAPMPAGALLFSPWTDLAMRGWSYVTKGVSSDSPFRMETAAFAARLYLGETLPTDPAASPAYAELQGFPPIAVHCSRHDMHFDDAVRLAEQADAAAVPVRVNYWDSPRHHLERFRSRQARQSIALAAGIAKGWIDSGCKR